jgi:hypothetical protein
MAAQKQQSAWDGVNGSSSSNATTGGFLPVQPLDTFDTSSYTDVSVPKSATPVQSNPADSWIATLPSEEEQMEMLRDEEAWNTVTTKKPSKKKREAAAESPIDSEPTVVQPQPTTKPRAASNGSGAAAPAGPAANKTTGKTAKPFSQQSSFAALSTNDNETEENEWEV